MSEMLEYRYDEKRYPFGPLVSSPAEMLPREREVYDLLDLIVSEWESDPTSVACFDLRIVERAKAAVAPYRQLRRQVRR